MLESMLSGEKKKAESGGSEGAASSANVVLIQAALDNLNCVGDAARPSSSISNTAAPATASRPIPSSSSLDSSATNFSPLEMQQYAENLQKKMSRQILGQAPVPMHNPNQQPLSLPPRIREMLISGSSSSSSSTSSTNSNNNINNNSSSSKK